MRICNECKNQMYKGYVINDGEEYYCTKTCLNKHYSEEEWEELYIYGNSYWTEWEKKNV